MGFVDAHRNSDVGRPDADVTVCVGRRTGTGAAWAVGGTYHVVRIIRCMLVEFLTGPTMA
ncbi:MAG: hypothetical protein H6518_13530 [Microthrixaceae bacterium]|nr:hypothetical protein [Microthrixaceae bacterium]